MSAMLKRLEEWYTLKQQLDDLKVREMKLRKDIFAGCFKNPVEGTNKLDLGDGYMLKATHNIDRKIDEAVFQALREPYFQEFSQSAERMVRTKMDLKVGEYKKQTAEERKMFDQALIIKEGSPQLEIIKPKRV